jgi:hypothetical protein
MRKLKLELDTLEVETFDTRETEAHGAGTVRAHSWYVTVDTYVNACSEPASQYCMETDYHWDTCGNSCINMCFPTGNDPSCAC